MKLIDNWKQSYKLKTVQVGALSAIFFALSLFSEHFITVWNLIPQDAKNLIPENWKEVVGCFVGVATVLARLKAQPEFHIQQFAKIPQVISKAGIDAICSYEGLGLEAYLDSANIWTIGYGTIIRNGVKVKKGDTCTIEQAKAYMASDLKSFEAAVNKVKVPLNQNQYDALVSLTYNIGVNAFANSTLLKKLNAQDYKGAAAQFVVWNKVKGRILQGLVNRRAKERKLFEKAL